MLDGELVRVSTGNTEIANGTDGKEERSSFAVHQIAGLNLIFAGWSCLIADSDRRRQPVAPLMVWSAAARCGSVFADAARAAGIAPHGLAGLSSRSGNAPYLANRLDFHDVCGPGVPADSVLWAVPEIWGGGVPAHDA